MRNITFKYDIGEHLIHKRSNESIIIDHYEVHLFNGFLYIVYCGSNQYGFQVKGREIDFNKEGTK